MSWQCRTSRRRMERSMAAARYADLDRIPHVEACASCRDYRAEMLALDSSLRALAPASQATPDVEQGVWREVDRRLDARGPQVSPLRKYVALAGLGALAVIVALFARGRTRPSPAEDRGAPPVVIAQHGTTQDQTHTPPMVASGTKEPSPRKKAPAVAKERPRRLIALHRRPRHRRHSGDYRIAKKQSQPAKSAVQVARLDERKPLGPPPHVAWAAWGAWYEQRGEYDRAALAYERAEAAAGKASPSIPVIYSYEAGRAAECAGDVSTAIDYYAKMLSRTSGSNAKPRDTKEGKGAQIWTPSGNEA